MANALCWQAGLIFLATGAAAQDCTADAFQRAVCALPQARTEWAVMETALAAVHGPSRQAVLATQARWIAMMGGWDVEATRAALLEEDTAQTLDFFEHDWGWRPKDMPDAEILTQIRNRTETIARLPLAYATFATLRQTWPGPYAVTATRCFYVAAEAMPNLRSDGFCGGTISLQHRDRVCSVMTYWYSGKINTVFSVDQVTGDGLRHLGHCDWNGPGPSCPGEGPASKDHWDSSLSPDIETLHRDLRQPPDGIKGGNDPEAWAALDTGDWFETCLKTEDYPPPAQTWAGNGPTP